METDLEKNPNSGDLLRIMDPSICIGTSGCLKPSGVPCHQVLIDIRDPYTYCLNLETSMFGPEFGEGS